MRAEKIHSRRDGETEQEGTKEAARVYAKEGGGLRKQGRTRQRHLTTLESVEPGGGTKDNLGEIHRRRHRLVQDGVVCMAKCLVKLPFQTTAAPPPRHMPAQARMQTASDRQRQAAAGTCCQRAYKCATTNLSPSTAKRPRSHAPGTQRRMPEGGGRASAQETGRESRASSKSREQMRRNQRVLLNLNGDEIEGKFLFLLSVRDTACQRAPFALLVVAHSSCSPPIAASASSRSAALPPLSLLLRGDGVA